MGVAPVEETKFARRFWRDGFVIVRGMFLPGEIAAMRQAALANPGPADLLSTPALRRVLLDPRLLRVFRELLGPDLVYFGDSSVSIGQAVPGFHKDNADKADPTGPDWQGRYTLARVGIYLQDHRGKPGGIDLRAGSHEHVSTRVGRHVYADTGLGDVVFWNLRTSHSGEGMTVLGRPIDPEGLAGKLLRRLPFLRDRQQRKRAALFATMAAPGPHLDRYAAYLATREYAVEGWRASHWDGAARADAANAGVALLDMPVQVRSNPPAVLHKGHVPLPH